MATKKNVKKTVKSNARRTAPKKAGKRAAPAKATTQTPSTPRTVTPYLAVNDAAGALEWYKKAFGAKVGQIMPFPGGKIGHAEVTLGDSTWYVSDIFPGSDLVDPTRAGASVSLTIYAKNVDQLWKDAVANGAKVTMPLADQFWGDRFGKVIDPYGHSWSLSYKSKLSKVELKKLEVEAMKQFGAGPS